MSGDSTPPAKTSRWKRSLSHLTSRGVASSSPPLSPSRSSRAVTSSTAQVTEPSSSQAISSSTAPTGPVFTNLSTAGTGPLLSPQVTSTPSSSSNLLFDALKRLSDDDRATLQDYICHNTSDIGFGLEQALVAAKEKQRYCIEKRWTFTIQGRTIAVKGEADKVVGWLNRFTAVGDVVANVDPMHVGLPWAGIRLLLEAAVSEANQMTLLLVGCETALYMANRLRVYIEFLHRVPMMLSRTNLETAVTELYARVLTFLARAIRIYQTSTPHRALRAFWTKGDIVDFEKACYELGVRVEIEASNCDRILSAQDQERSERLRQDLQKVLGELEQSHLLQESLDRLEIKIDLDKLPYAKGAMYNSYEDEYITCHPATRVDLLHNIHDWAQDSRSKSIFWLSGWAGTGKSTISRTVAEWLAGQSGRGGINLGASFFFKRGEGDRGSASRFFSTIVRELVLRIPGLGAIVAEVVAQDPLIFDKALGEQFDKLIYRPLRQVDTVTDGCSTFIVVVDALDECEKERDVEAVIHLWDRLVHLTSIRLKLFLTSRPELPIQLAFKSMSTDIHQHMVLQDAVPQTTIQHDILIYLKDAFDEIRNRFNRDFVPEIPLDEDWPSNKSLQALADVAVPLFIVAATVCRFVENSAWDPREQLETILHFPGFGKLEQMAQTYLPVLNQVSARFSNSNDKDILYQEFRMIVGSIVSLAEPLSRQSLADLLNIPPDKIALRLRLLHSVLCIPVDPHTAIRTLHLSFNEYLLSDQLQSSPLGISGQATHRMLLAQCLRLLSGSGGLQENLCQFEDPGKQRREIDPAMINDRLSPALRYACQYWVQHVQYGKVEIHDEDDVHIFLQRHFLHWLEAMSLINRLVAVIEQLSALQSLLSSNSSSLLSDFLQDAQRIILANRHSVDLAPLQIYSSAMVFAPQASIVRKVCGRVPSWIRQYPITPLMWSLELQKLEGHGNIVNIVVFSHDGSQLASASDDGTIRLWNPVTGQEVQRLKGHTDGVSAIAFLPDSSSLVSVSLDKTIRLWNLRTSQSQEVQKLEGHPNPNSAVALSPNGLVLAAALGQTLRLRDPITGQELQTLEGHTGMINTVAFSHDGSLLASGSHDYSGSSRASYSVYVCGASRPYDQTTRLWNLATGQEVRKLEGYNDRVMALVFSQDGSLLASASSETIRLWNPITGQELQKLEGYNDRVMAIVFSKDGSLLASALGDRTIRLWDLATGQEVQKLEAYTGWVWAVAFSQDGSLLASGSSDQIVKLWKPARGQRIQKLGGHNGEIITLKFSYNGLLLASASHDRTLRLWDPITGHELQKLEGHTDSVNTIAFSQDNSLLASGSYDNTIRLWNPITGQEIQKLEKHTKVVSVVAFSNDGSLLASGSYDKTIRLWNPITGQEIQKLEKHTKRVTVVAFSNDGSLLASGSFDQTIRLWNPTTGQEVKTLNGHNGHIHTVAFSQDGSLLASSSYDQTTRLWDPTTGQEVQKLFNRGLTTLPSASYNGFMILENPTTGEKVHVVCNSGWSPPGSAFDGFIIVPDPVTGQNMRNNLVSRIRELKFSNDNETLLSDWGTIDLKTNSIVMSNLGIPSNSPLTVGDDWIRRDGRGFLRLPREYRDGQIAFHGNAIAFGLHSGQVSILQFN